MKVYVRKWHIKQGHAKSKDCCPIALALKAQGKVNVTVDNKAMAYGTESSGMAVVVLPPAAVAFVDRFDRGLPVSPFQFKVSEND